MCPDDNTPNVVEVQCAGGCGEPIQIPQHMADMINHGQAEAPKCLPCLRADRAAKLGPRGVTPPPGSKPAQDAQEVREAPAVPGGAGTRPGPGPGTVGQPGEPQGRTSPTMKAPGPAPTHTTLVVTMRKQHAERGKRGGLGFTFELHPCAQDRGVPEWQHMARFARAVAAHARQLAPKGRRTDVGKGEGLGVAEGIRRQALGLDRVMHMAKGVMKGAGVMDRLHKLRRGKEDKGGGGGR